MNRESETELLLIHCAVAELSENFRMLIRNLQFSHLYIPLQVGSEEKRVFFMNQCHLK